MYMVYRSGFNKNDKSSFYFKKSIVLSSEVDFNKRIRWRSARFKEPLKGFENELKLREFRLSVERSISAKETPLIMYSELDFKRLEFYYRLYLKNKLYPVSVRSNSWLDLNELDFPFFTKEAWASYQRKQMFIQMYARAVKKRLQTVFNIEALQKKAKADSLLQNLKTNRIIITDNSDIIWSINKRMSVESSLSTLFIEEDILAYLLKDYKKDFSINNENIGLPHACSNNIQKKREEDLDVFFNRNITKTLAKYSGTDICITVPYFMINFSTGTVDYDFWNNTAERVEERNTELRLMALGKKPVTDHQWKRDLLYIPTLKLRGLHGPLDFALLRQRKYPKLLLKRRENKPYLLPYYTQIYNWFQAPKEAVIYSKLVYGLVGPVVAPHWCLVFTITKTRKNIYFTVADMVGKVILTISAGRFNIHRRKRLSPYALEPMYQKVLASLKKLKIKNIILILKFKAKYLYMHTLNFFRNNQIFIRSVWDKYPIPHNGIRSRKQRRL